jgi:hypothetical protein
MPVYTFEAAASTQEVSPVVVRLKIVSRQRSTVPIRLVS